jgi:DeoR family glycerol-3-phosphate regulon repressor
VDAFLNRWQNAILEAVRRDGRARISELARRLAISDETVRRHIRPLVARGLVRREHGAVVWAGSSEAPFARRLQVQAEAKRAIARVIAERVEDGLTVMLDTGSTTAYVAQALVRRSRLTVITNGLEIARSLVGRNGHKVYLAGGELDARLAAALGPEALAFVDQFRADLAILSIAAIDAEEGLMDFELDEARIARAMMHRAKRVIIAADRTKFGRRAAVRVAALSEIDELVTDAPPPEPFPAQLAAAGVELIVAPAATAVAVSTV